MSVYLDGKHLLSEDDLSYLPVNQTNLLTDSQMNLTNWEKSSAATYAISNLTYSNGVNHFHYRGVADYERFRLALTNLTKNTNYRVYFDFKFSNQINYLGSDKPYLPVQITKPSAVLNDDNTTNNLVECRIPLPQKSSYSNYLDFNSGDFTGVYFKFNLGYTMDVQDNDIDFSLKLIEMPLVMSDINSVIQKLSNRITNLGG